MYGISSYHQGKGGNCASCRTILFPALAGLEGVLWQLSIKSSKEKSKYSVPKSTAKATRRGRDLSCVSLHLSGLFHLSITQNKFSWTKGSDNGGSTVLGNGVATNMLDYHVLLPKIFLCSLY